MLILSVYLSILILVKTNYVFAMLFSSEISAAILFNQKFMKSEICSTQNPKLGS